MAQLVEYSSGVQSSVPHKLGEVARACNNIGRIIDSIETTLATQLIRD